MSTPISVFVDFESLGMPRRAGAQIKQVDWFFDRLPAAMRLRRYEVREAVVFASSHGKRTTPVSDNHKSRISEAVNRYNASMIWSKTLADTALIVEVSRRVDQADLPQAVLLVSNDGHFARVVEMLREHGHNVIVAGSAMSQNLREAASLAIPLKDLLG